MISHGTLDFILITFTTIGILKAEGLFLVRKSRIQSKGFGKQVNANIGSQ